MSEVHKMRDESGHLCDVVLSHDNALEVKKLKLEVEMLRNQRDFHIGFGREEDISIINKTITSCEKEITAAISKLGKG